MGHSEKTIRLECQLFKHWNAISLDVWELFMVLVDGTKELESMRHATGPRNDGEVRTFCSQRQILGSTLHKGCDNTT